MKNFTNLKKQLNVNIKRMVCITFIILAFTFGARAQYTLTDDDVEVVDGIITTVSYDFSETDIIIPDVLDNQTVTGIETEDSFNPDAFMGRDITSIELPSTLISIGEYAFRLNDLTSIILPDGLQTIGYGAFGANGLDFTSIDLPNSIIFIGEFAFSLNGFSTITLPSPSYPNFTHWIDNESQTTYEPGDIVDYSGQSFRAKIIYTLTENDVEIDADGIISSCSYDFGNGFKDIIIPEAIGGNAITGIGDGGWDGIFEDQGIYSVELPQGLKTIGNNAFNDNNLISINLPSELVSIGGTAFYWNDLNDISLPNTLIHIGYRAFGANNIDNIVLPTPPNNEFEEWITAGGDIYAVGTTVSAGSYSSFSAKIVYTLTDEDVVVENGVIQSCDSESPLKYLIIPQVLDGQTVTGIANGSEPTYSNPVGVFLQKGIEEVQLPQTLETIGDYAFYNNDIKEIDIPEGVIYLGLDAFTLNSNLSGIVLPSPQAPNIGGWIDNYGNTYNGGESISSFFGRSYTADFSTAIFPASTRTDQISISVNNTEKTITINAQKPITAYIFDTTGRKVYSADNKAKNHFINISNFSTGLYIITCEDNAGAFITKKIIAK
jgi:hypothetical protein